MIRSAIIAMACIGLFSVQACSQSSDKGASMKLTIEQHMERFKAQHGDGEVTVDSSGRLNVPRWLLEMVRHLSGVRSKKRRIVKKTITRKINELLEQAANDS